MLKKREASEIKDEHEKLKLLEKKIEKSHDPLTFKLFNSKKYLEKLKI